jgi:hypothetical protein
LSWRKWWPPETDYIKGRWWEEDTSVVAEFSLEEQWRWAKLKRIYKDGEFSKDWKMWSEKTAAKWGRRKVLSTKHIRYTYN